MDLSLSSSKILEENIDVKLTAGFVIILNFLLLAATIYYIHIHIYVYVLYTYMYMYMFVLKTLNKKPAAVSS